MRSTSSSGGDRLVVVAEVKARRSPTPTDRRRPRSGSSSSAASGSLAAEWLAATGVRGVEVRFDVVAITGDHLDVITGAF